MRKIIASVFLIACGITYGQFHESELFPMHIGYCSKLENSNCMLEIQVIKKIIYEEKELYQISETIIKGIKKISSGIYYLHENKIGDIEKFCRLDSLINKANKSFDWYKKNVKVGESWITYSDSYFNNNSFHKYKITLISKLDTVTIGKKLFKKCYKYFIDDLSEKDTEYYDWIVPGLGLVKRTFISDLSNSFERVF